MKNPITTISGALGAGLYALQDYLTGGGRLDDWKFYIVPVAIAAIGYLSPDPKRKPRKPKPKAPRPLP